REPGRRPVEPRHVSERAEVERRGAGDPLRARSGIQADEELLAGPGAQSPHGKTRGAVGFHVPPDHDDLPGLRAEIGPPTPRGHDPGELTEHERPARVGGGGSAVYSQRLSMKYSPTRAECASASTTSQTRGAGSRYQCCSEPTEQTPAPIVEGEAGSAVAPETRRARRAAEASGSLLSPEAAIPAQSCCPFSGFI